MTIEDLKFHYYVPAEPTLKPGATTGYLVMGTGQPGDATIWDAVAVTDDDGFRYIDVTGEGTATTVVDDG